MADMDHGYDYYDNGLMFEGKVAWDGNGDGGWYDGDMGGVFVEDLRGDRDDNDAEVYVDVGAKLGGLVVN